MNGIFIQYFSLTASPSCEFSNHTTLAVILLSSYWITMAYDIERVVVCSDKNAKSARKQSLIFESLDALAER